MFEKLLKMEENYEAISERLTNPETIADTKLYAQLMKEYKNLSPIIEKFRELKKAKDELSQAEEMIEASSDDPEMREMAQEEFTSLKEKNATLTDELKILLLPKDPDDDKNVII